MNPQKRAPRRPRNVQLAPETLETRALMTGGAGDTFAIIPGTISKPGGTVSVSFTIDPAHFTRPTGKMVLGIDVAAGSGSTVKPFISSVTDPHGHIVQQAFHSIYAPHLKHVQVANGNGTSAILTPIISYPHDPSKPVTYTVQVQGVSNTSGNFLLGFYLPGDANGDGSVTKADLQTVKSLHNVTANSSNYNFNADTNRDGRIGQVDVAYTEQNMGVSTNITPVVSANLDTTSVTNPSGRSTTKPTATFTGTASPGATVTYTDTDNNNGGAVTTTVNSTGNYTITVPLGVGSNTFNVKSVDAFGQTISGNISPVFYNPPPK